MSSVEIRDLSVPSYVEYGTPDMDSLILDCNYDFSEAERGQLDVKWYFNGEHSPFLQWLPGRKPQVIGDRFQGHIDLDFTVDEDDHKMHRAIKLVNLKPESDLNKVDRLGLHRKGHEILGLSIPQVEIPVAAGRDTARLVAVAALDHQLRRLGYDMADEFNQKLLAKMAAESRAR